MRARPGGVDLLLGSSHAVTTAEAFTEVYREALAPTAAEPWATDWTSKGAEVWTWVHVHRSEAMLASMLAAGINANGLLHDRHMLHYLSSAPRWYYDRRMITCIYCISIIRTISRMIIICTRLYMDLIRYGRWLAAAEGLLASHSLNAGAARVWLRFTKLTMAALCKAKALLAQANPAVRAVVKSGRLTCAGDAGTLPVGKASYAAADLVRCFGGGDTGLIELLLSHGSVSVDAEDGRRNTALHYAAYHGHAAAARALLAANATGPGGPAGAFKRP